MDLEEGPHYKYRNIEFWAERGMITLVDLDQAGNSQAKLDRACKRISINQFFKQAFAAFHTVPETYSTDVRDVNRMFEQAMAAINLAKKQGDPTNVKVQEHHAKHERPVQILVPGGGTGSKLAGVTYKLRPGQDAKKVFLGEEAVNIVPDLTIPMGADPRKYFGMQTR